MSARIPVAVLGATGVVGQRLVARLATHPLFEARFLCASEKSAGKTYAEACGWRLGPAWGPAHGGLESQRLLPAEPAAAPAPVALSALDAEPARTIEPAFAAAGALVSSNASAFRLAADVPLLIPEINADHVALLEGQRQARGWRGGIVCNPNCTATVLALALAPLERAFGIEAVIMTSMQALSGAGYPGVASLDIHGNVIPFIRGEEEKLEAETRKLLGRVERSAVAPAGFAVSAACHRVPVADGHTEAVSLRLRGNPGPADVRAALLEWAPPADIRRLASSPERAIRVHDAEDRPQPLLDVEVDRGMSVHVGRIRACSVLGIKLELLGHNAERGAAGAALLNAELVHARGLLA